MSCSITAHERSSSSRMLALSKMVLNKFKEMLVWSLRPGSILGCLVTGTVMKERKKSKNQKQKYSMIITNTNNQRDMKDIPSIVAKINL
jgi:hypothetical protein